MPSPSPTLYCALCTPVPPPIPTGLRPQEIASIAHTVGTLLAVLIAVGVLIIVIVLTLIVVWGTKE